MVGAAIIGCIGARPSHLVAALDSVPAIVLDSKMFCMVSENLIIGNIIKIQTLKSGLILASGFFKNGTVAN
jgi:hypothetical protein